MTNIVALVKLYCLFKTPEAVVCMKRKTNKTCACKHCMHFKSICKPRNFSETIDSLQAQLKWIGIIWWMEKLSIVFNIFGCRAEEVSNYYLNAPNKKKRKFPLKSENSTICSCRRFLDDLINECACERSNFCHRK